MAVARVLLTRLEGGETNAQLLRDVLQGLGFVAYRPKLVDGTDGAVGGWIDPLSGNVMLVGIPDLEHALAYLPTGWVSEIGFNVQGKRRVRVAPDAGRLASATFTKFVDSEPLAMFLAIVEARGAL